MGELDFLIKGISSITWQQLIMFAASANIASQVSYAIAGGIVLTLFL